MRNYYTRSTHKFEKNILNEDAAIAKKNMIAVSDGAGGGGVFADRWSKYLLMKLPASPISSFKELDAWVDSIWEPFYNECEIEAKERGGLFLEKFYDEGSFATIAAAWKTSETEWKWMTYGDSVVFCYDKNTGLLCYSPIHLTDFDTPPYLISDKDPLNEVGFKHGCFNVSENSTIFAATDALAHYILMMYEISKRESYKGEISNAIAAKTKSSNYIDVAMSMRFSFPSILCSLLDRHTDFRSKMRKLENTGLLAHDDYSIAVAE
jgi:hypothetical protein